MKVKYLSKKEFEYIYNRVPRLCVEAVIKTEKGIVLTKRNIEPAKGTWHMPGGTVLKGETLINAIKRIIKLELGIDIVIEKMLEVAEPKLKNYSKQVISIVFFVRPKNKKLNFVLDQYADNVSVFDRFPKNTLKYHVDIIKKYKLL
ncbi:MAG: NUDIX domain-containing protein [Patescibacteria group bacterium]|nr:NUDIX domain-containing protein [Patescibacteria group bacterium]